MMVLAGAALVVSLWAFRNDIPRGVVVAKGNEFIFLDENASKEWMERNSGKKIVALIEYNDGGKKFLVVFRSGEDAK